MFEVKITGMKELKQNMDAVVKDMKDAMEIGTNEAAEYAAGIVRGNTPVGPTGNLLDAVTTKALPRKKGYAPNTMVGLDYRIAPHQHLVEFGSVRSRANPFFRRSIDQAGSGVKQRIARRGREPIDRRR